MITIELKIAILIAVSYFIYATLIKKNINYTEQRLYLLLSSLLAFFIPFIIILFPQKVVLTTIYIPEVAVNSYQSIANNILSWSSGPPTHEVLQQALQALERLSHRGGVDADGASGDGAGLLTSLPAAFFQARAAEQDIQLGEKFGVGMLFVPAARVADARAAMEEAIGRGKMRLAGWRRVPVNSNALGQRAFESMPEIWQFFIEPIPTKNGTPNAAAKFERGLALLRKRAEGCLPEKAYLCSLSSRTVVYKGLLTPWGFLDNFTRTCGARSLWRGSPYSTNDIQRTRNLRGNWRTIESSLG